MSRSSLLRVSASLLLILSTACKKDPATPEYWEGELKEAHLTPEKLRVLEALDRSRELKPNFLPLLHNHLASEKSSQVRAELSRMLGELKDPSSVDPLLAVVNAPETRTADGNTLMREAISALGAIGDPRAEEPLVRLLGSADPFTRLQAMESLGRLKSQKAVGPLLQIVQDPNSDPLLVKRALSTLGDIGDPRGVPVLVQMLFDERGGTSFYPESAFALFQLGRPARDEMLGVLKGEDPKVSEWAASKGIPEAVLFAKAAQVLGDMDEPRAEGALVERLSFKGAEPAQTALVRITAANALGRLHSKAGAKALMGMLDQEPAEVRAEFAHAVVLGGGQEAAPALAKAAATGSWEGREALLGALSLVATDVAVFEKLAKEEPATLAAGCKKDPKDPGCVPAQRTLVLQKRQATILGDQAPAKAAEQCKADSACWSQKLFDADPHVQRRAAVELARTGKPEAAQALASHLSEKDPETRAFIIDALTWLVDHSAEAAQKVRSQLPNLEKQLAEEKGRTDYQRVNEDLRRLTAKLHQAA